MELLMITYCYVKGTCAPVVPPSKVRGEWSRNTPPFGCPWQQCFCLGPRFSKRKITRYTKYFIHFPSWRSDKAASFSNLFVASGFTWPSPLSWHPEKFFSNLEVIKTYLRSPIQQKHLNSLANMSIDSASRRCLNLDKILRNFANVKAGFI